MVRARSSLSEAMISTLITSRIAASFILAAGLCGAATHVLAQAWPAKPVKVVVPFPAGGSTDVLARLLSKKLSEVTGQPFVVENRAGANGNLGASAVATAAPDGYTLLFTTTGPLVYNRFLYKSTPFDPAKDFTPIVKAAEIPLLVAVHPSVPANNLADLVRYAKAHPGKLTYSTAGNGSMGHLTAELLQREAGFRITHVPYKGSAPALSDLMAGTVNLSFDLAPTYAQHVRSGKVRALAVTTGKRTPLMPDTPTLAEQGIAGIEATGWSAFVGPAGLPADVVRRVNDVVNAFVASDEGRQELSALGMQPSGGTPEQLAAFIAAQTRAWEPVAKSVVIE
jgi:tripartite-type tricarboxylate transporter receptor subunit TctC